MNKNISSTFEREMKNQKFKKAFDESYEKFLLVELSLEKNTAAQKRAKTKNAKIEY